MYKRQGALLAESFRAGHFALPFSPITGTNFIRVVTGAVYTVFGPTRLGGYMAFGWFSFLGLFLFYRAFTIAMPEGRSRTYARLVFFLPSLVFWPSGIGKEAWMVFALGVAAFGAARLLSGSTVRGIVIAGLGAWMAAMVRPHVAGLIGLAIAATPRANSIQASLPIPDGQKTSEGRKNTRRAYVRERPSGTAIVNAR